MWLAGCATPIAGHPALDDLRSGTLVGIAEEPITLLEGAYQGPSVAPGSASRLHVTLWEEPLAFGDLDGQPGDEAVALVSSSGGGSATLVYVVAFGRRDGHLTRGTATLVGDRIKVLALSIADRRVTLDFLEAGPGDPLCCPTRLARRTYALQGGALVPVATTPLRGSLSLADLSGTEWTLLSLDDRPLPAGSRAPSLVIEGTRVSGSAGCNRYTGTIVEKTAGAVSVGLLAATNITCAPAIMDVETRYLAALARVSRYTVVAGRLQLIHVDDGTASPLTFERREATPSGDQPH